MSYALQNVEMVKYFLKNVANIEIVTSSNPSSKIQLLLKIAGEKGYTESAKILQAHLDLWAAMPSKLDFDKLERLVEGGLVAGDTRIKPFNSLGKVCNSLIEWLVYQVNVKKEQKYQALIDKLKK